MSTEPNNNHSNTGTRNAGAVLGAVSVLVALFYVSEYLFGYNLPGWLNFSILLALTCVLALIIILIFSFSKKIANFLGKKEFHTDIKLFICPLILIVTISMLSFTIESYNCGNTANKNAVTCESKAPEKKKKSEKTEKKSSNKKKTTVGKSVTSNSKTNKNASSGSNASKDTKDPEDKAKIKSEEQAFLNRSITFVVIVAIFYIAQLRKTAMKNEYDETKIDLDYMQKRNRYVIYNINDPNAAGEIKELTKKKEELRYYNSMKNNYGAIAFFFAFISLIMGFSKLG